ncbi:MAG TPA: alpha-L-fucosidase, partial [Bryobacterales bacterium]|nr:alpha-L-fucosidase [Bryobacterales bacterium]
MSAWKPAAFFAAALFAAGVAASAQSQHPFEPTWESLEQYHAPRWYQDAKFGIFLHWGVYAVPAYGSEWYPRRMYQQYKTDSRGKSSGVEEPTFQWHREHWGPQSKFGYKDFIPLFKAEKWNPDEWAELFQKAGAKYVVPVAEHHDGFAMYASTRTKWNA